MVIMVSHIHIRPVVWTCTVIIISHVDVLSYETYGDNCKLYRHTVIIVSHIDCHMTLFGNYGIL
jgi:hypothetical protein